MMSEPRLAFVVGTGRCGSTLLGELLGTHPDAVTINEYLVSIEPDPLADRMFSGAEFLEQLSRPHPILSLLVRHYIDPEELRYPIDDQWSRFSRSTGLPGLVAAAIPAITDAPDEVWDQLCEDSGAWSLSDGAGHFRNLARWFAERSGASVVVERSGGSLRFVDALVRSFPTSKFVHIHREGRAAAQSMARHPFFQLSALRRRVFKATGHDMFDMSLDQAAREAIAREIPGLTPWAFDTATFRAQRPLPPAEFGALWSSLLCRGTRTLRSLPDNQVLHIDYGRFCDAPIAELATVAEFLRLEPRRAWLRESAARVRASQRNETPSDERLERACAPGEVARRKLMETAGGVPSATVSGEQG